jgi:hypothetical protein
VFHRFTNPGSRGHKSRTYKYRRGASSVSLLSHQVFHLAADQSCISSAVVTSAVSPLTILTMAFYSTSCSTALPTEMLWAIMSGLGPKDLKSVSLVSRRFSVSLPSPRDRVGLNTPCCHMHNSKLPAPASWSTSPSRRKIWGSSLHRRTWPSSLPSLCPG